jgi:hypothetical protein
MIAIAVRPIAMPIGTRAVHAPEIAMCHGDSGCCSAVAKIAAEHMNSARHTISLAYSRR